MLLILGKSELGSALQSLIPDSIIVGRPEFDVRNKTDCDQLIAQYNPTVLVNTIGVYQNSDVWDILTTNYVSAVYLTMGFYNKMQNGQIINISSASTYWPSYPGIDDQRLTYNISKESLSNFGRHYNRKIVDDNKVTVTTVEIGKFSSRFNNYSGGMAIETAALIVKNVINNPITSISVIR